MGRSKLAFIAAFIVLLAGYSIVMSGTVTRVSSTKSTGDPLTAAEYNGDIDAIISGINGNIDATNLKDGAVTEGKIAADAITPAKVDEDNATAFAVKNLDVTNQITCSSMTATYNITCGSITATATSTAAVTVSSNIVLLNQAKVVFNESENMCIYRPDSSAMALMVGTHTVLGLRTSDGSAIFQSEKKVFLDGGSDTYIREGAANQINFVVNDDTACIMAAAGWYPQSDGGRNIGAGASNDIGTIYYHTLSQDSGKAKKTDIAAIEDSQISASLLPAPKKYRRKSKMNVVELGLIAEECPEDVRGYDNEGNPVIHTNALISYMCGVIKKQDARISTLENQIILLNTRIDRLDDKVNK